MNVPVFVAIALSTFAMSAHIIGLATGVFPPLAWMPLAWQQRHARRLAVHGIRCVRCHDHLLPGRANPERIAQLEAEPRIGQPAVDIDAELARITPVDPTPYVTAANYRTRNGTDYWIIREPDGRVTAVKRASAEEAAEFQSHEPQ